MKLAELIQNIRSVQQQLQQTVASSVNQGLSVRNWLVGYYLVEFQQKGEERAKYGDQLLATVSKKINQKGFSTANLSRYRQFYMTYPKLLESSSSEFQKIPTASILASLTQELKEDVKQHPEVVQKLSFTHFVELIKIEDPFKRYFYEVLCIKGTWSVRELKRQIHSLYYERTAMSKDKSLLTKMTHEQAEKASPSDQIKDIYVFEFLNLPQKHLVTETELEVALLDNLQHLILELGEGFCFEARQKRILIGEEYFFIDLVFYHRILKCHVLIDLKMDKFKHLHVGQVNTYINYYNDQIKQADDNPAIGILLVTDKNKALVKYATAGMEEQVFIQKYMVELPTEEYIMAEIQKLIDEQL